MDLKEYKTKTEELEKRYKNIEKEVGKQKVLFEQKQAEMEALGIKNIKELKGKIKDLETDLVNKRNTLDEYLQKIETKIESIEGLMND